MIEAELTLGVPLDDEDRIIQLAETHGGELRSCRTTYDRRVWVPSKVHHTFRFTTPIKAAIFLATISADPERAAMFKMFWSGE